MTVDNIVPSSGSHVGVLMGGLSAEREVSLQTGEAVHASLVDRGYRATRIFVDNDVDLVLRQAGIDVAFIALHGRYGEDGCVQGLLEMLGIPYTGSDVLASALAMNKVKAKEMFRLHNLPTPPYYVIRGDAGLRAEDLLRVHAGFGFPAVVKPCREGSSVGVYLVRNFAELRDAVEGALRFDGEAMVERYIDGMEVQVAILNDRPLGAIEVVPEGPFFDYESKYADAGSRCFFPARLSRPRYQGVLRQARRAHQALGCSGVTRVDMIVSEMGNEFVLEVNTLPGLTPTSLVPKIAAGGALSFDDLVEEILAGAALQSRAQRFGLAAGLPASYGVGATASAMGH